MAYFSIFQVKSRYNYAKKGIPTKVFPILDNVYHVYLTSRLQKYEIILSDGFLMSDKDRAKKYILLA